MKSKYFIIPKVIADELGISEYRYGNGSDGYLVNTGDLAVYGVERAIQNGAREITATEATEFTNHNK
jgi:hypothetical protein